MKKLLALAVISQLLSGKPASAAGHRQQGSDSVYLFSYTSNKNNNRIGLQLAWSNDKKNWNTIGNGYSFLKSDYGAWGSGKRMLNPFLVQGKNQLWYCVWQLSETDLSFANAASTDLLNWHRQRYTKVGAGKNVVRPAVSFNSSTNMYDVVYTDTTGKYFKVSTNDFKSFTKSQPVAANQYKDSNTSISLTDGNVTGQVYRVSRAFVDNIIKQVDAKNAKWNLARESTAQDPQRFAGLQPFAVSMTAQPEKAKAISDKLIGIFFEDINYAADGGLYAELIQNRDFEYSPADRQYRDSTWNSKHSWTLKGPNATFTIDSIFPVHPNNAHYAVLEIAKVGASLENAGYDGIALKKNESYELSVFLKQLAKGPVNISVRLVNKDGSVIAEKEVAANKTEWTKSTVELTATTDAKEAHLELQPLSVCKVGVDMVSLFPQKTFKGRKNGMRSDLAQTVADIRPRFIRFPGGCLTHGDGIDNIYRWKNTIGPVESRKQQRNIWNYHQSMGLGFFEYFQYCEDIGATPLPVVAAGVPCQNSSCGPNGCGQQGGIPMSEMGAYIQDILDLVEWANGEPNTKWGRLRADAGHPAPFNLKYLGVGNEDLISDVFEERFTMIYNALKKSHPEITVIGTVGPFFEGTDYNEGWALANKLKVPMVDEHYYESPGWFINNQHFYDSYDRTKSKVYLGEYAAHSAGRSRNLEAALAEALYLTSIERNGDVVSMASYAPLLAREGHTQWNPNLIYFNGSEVKTTVSYEVQKLYGNNAGEEYVPASVNIGNDSTSVQKRIAYSIVREKNTGDVIIKLVNILPVAVKASINTAGITTAAKATKTTLTGLPADTHAAPEVLEIAATELNALSLPPYSFTVIRCKAK
jgi:alpha-L-arabinofuranosidase